MLNDVAKEWVKALRSGEYTQGKTYLRSADDKFCCIGVLCDLAVEAGIIPAPTEKSEYAYIFGGLCTPPKEVKNWAGLASYDAAYGNESLTRDNDVRGKTFTEIADIIESEPAGLFV